MTKEEQASQILDYVKLWTTSDACPDIGDVMSWMSEKGLRLSFDWTPPTSVDQLVAASDLKGLPERRSEAVKDPQMSTLTNIHFIPRRPSKGTAFLFPKEGGDCIVDLDAYVIAPKELFTDAEINALHKKADELYTMRAEIRKHS